MVTADSQILAASELQHQYLFWAIRVGGGNFGVSTWFEFQLHPFGPEIFAAATMYPMDAAGKILRMWRSFYQQTPDEVTTDIAFWKILPMPGIDSELVDKPIIVALGFYAGSPEDVEHVFSRFASFMSPSSILARPGAMLTSMPHSMGCFLPPNAATGVVVIRRVD